MHPTFSSGFGEGKYALDDIDRLKEMCKNSRSNIVKPMVIILDNDGVVTKISTQPGIFSEISWLAEIRLWDVPDI